MKMSHKDDSGGKQASDPAGRIPSTVTSPPRDNDLAGLNRPPEADNDICFLDAREMATLMAARELSSREIMQAHLRQIARLNPGLNAIVTLLSEDDLLLQAQAADEAVVRGEALGPLHGIPVGVKDSHQTKGIRTTFGSPLFRDFVPQSDCLIVEREKRAGAILIGKTNLPEFGLGSHTFNAVFGATRNPYDSTKTCGGSSGGAAVALASGMVPLADGSDMGGSLRNPPNFCNVVGMRTSPGRVPNAPSQLGWFTQGVAGPLARTVSDCAYFLSALAGFDRRSPISIENDGKRFVQPLGQRDFKGVRVAFMKDLGLPWDPQVKNAIGRQRKIFEALGCIVDETEPDLRDANECFLAWRHWMMELQYGEMLDKTPDKLNEYIHWHVVEGRKLTGPLPRASGSQAHGALPSHAPIHGGARIFHFARESSAALRRERTLPQRDRRHENGELLGVDEIGLLHLSGGKSRYLGSLRLLGIGPADWNANRRPA